MDNIISNCPHCEERSLHLLGELGKELMQCNWCGYVSSPKFKGTKDNNEEYKKLTDDMKLWSKEALDRIWIPSIFTLPDGMIYPENVNGSMKWKLADLVELSSEEQDKYPDENGGFYKQKYDTDNPKVYDNFYEVMSVVNERAKDKASKDNMGVELKLPKLGKSN